MIKKTRKIRSPLKQQILLLLLAGVAIGLAQNPRRQWRIIKSLPRELKKVNDRYLYRSLNEFRRDRLVSYQERKDGSVEIILTDKGKRKALRFNIDSLIIKKPRKWDGRWRLVIFDIPEFKRQGRDALRLKLKELGFFEWQKSVFIYPYPCRDEIDFIVEFFELRPYVRYAELLMATNEAELRLHFDL